MVKFVPALACLFCLALLGTCLVKSAYLISEPCRVFIINALDILPKTGRLLRWPVPTPATPPSFSSWAVEYVNAKFKLQRKDSDILRCSYDRYIANLFWRLVSGEECREFGPCAVVLQHEGSLLLRDFGSLGLGLGQVSLGLDEFQSQVEDLLGGRRFHSTQRRFHL